MTTTEPHRIVQQHDGVPYELVVHLNDDPLGVTLTTSGMTWTYHRFDANSAAFVNFVTAWHGVYEGRSYQLFGRRASETGFYTWVLVGGRMNKRLDQPSQAQAAAIWASRLVVGPPTDF